MEDTPGTLDDPDLEGSNIGLCERSNYFKNSKSVDMIGLIYNDLFKLSRYLPNQLGVVVKFYRSKPEFCLISNATKPEFTIHLEDMVLKIAKVKVNPSMQNS